MTTRRNFLAVLGGGVILSAAGFGFAATRMPKTAHLPWSAALEETDVRRRALSFALLAPNPHNRQPWKVDLSNADEVTLFADADRMLPHTDPFNRQITIGLGGFLHLMQMAAAEQGYRVQITPFPQGSDDKALDTRPVASALFIADANVKPDPMFAAVLARRSNKEPYDTGRTVSAEVLAQILTAVPGAGGSVDQGHTAELRSLTHEALRIEIETPHTYRESVDLFRIGRREVDASPDGIDFAGPLFEGMHLTGLFTREAAMHVTSQAYKAGLEAVFANTDTAMGHIWLVSQGNERLDQMAAGAAWLRLNLACTAAGVATQPLSQALQEYPEMAALYAEIHTRIAPDGGTVQMLARIGYGPEIGPSPRWPLDAKVI
jgi:hypothetical protein